MGSRVNGSSLSQGITAVVNGLCSVLSVRRYTNHDYINQVRLWAVLLAKAEAWETTSTLYTRVQVSTVTKGRMKITTLPLPATPPLVTGYVLELTVNEMHDLRALASIPDSILLPDMRYANDYTHDIRGLLASLRQSHENK